MRRASSARPEPAIASSSDAVDRLRQNPQGLDHRTERQALASEREATTLEDTEFCPEGETFELTHKTGLADAGLTADEDDSWMA